MKRELSGLRIATIRGVDLKVHYSLIFLLAYVVFVASAQFPFVIEASELNPELISGSPLVWGFMFSLGLFFSVVLHEFGHVILAQSMGVNVSGVTLMMLGGVSEMERIPEKPYAEFKVSIMGPLVSLALAAVFFIVSQKTRSPNLSLFTYWLSRANLVLGVFNLLPAFPMDGGRVLRSLLAVKQGMIKATVTTVSVAKTLSWVLGLFGFLQFNFILMLIALFIYSAANSELIISESRKALKGITVGELGRRILPVSELATLRQVATRMLQTKTRILPVQIGLGGSAVITLGQLKRIPTVQWSDILVKDIIRSLPHNVEASSTIEEILPEIIAMGAIPFREHGVVVGVLQYIDVEDLIDFKSLDEPIVEEEVKRVA